MKIHPNSNQSAIKAKAIKDFSDHVSSGKAAFFQKYGMDLVMGPRKGPYMRDIDRAGAAADDECRELTREAFRQALRKTDEWTHQVQSLPVARQNKWTYRHYWQRQNARAAIRVK